MKPFWLILLPLAAQAGPLIHPAQCRILRNNLEQVHSLTEQQKDDEFWACMGRAESMKRAMIRMNENRRKRSGSRKPSTRHLTLLDWQTLERPWEDNQEDISCVPAGIYFCVRRLSPHFGYEVFELQNVPDRTNIEIHRANWVRQLLGCIALGMTRDEQTPAIGHSEQAFNAFMERMDGIQQFKLDIRDPA
jgi:hypothetical protein